MKHDYGNISLDKTDIMHLPTTQCTTIPAWPSICVIHEYIDWLENHLVKTDNLHCPRMGAACKD